MKKLIEKFTGMPKFIQVLMLTIVTSAVAALAFYIDFRIVVLLIAAIYSIVMYKPFKAHEDDL